MKTVVTGGRDYNDWGAIFQRLDAIHKISPISHLYHGACRDKRTRELIGADKWCERWAISRSVPYTGEPAQWEKYDVSAGPIRNQLMLDKYAPERGISFPGGPGTADMVRRMKKAGIYWEEDKLWSQSK